MSTERNTAIACDDALDAIGYTYLIRLKMSAISEPLPCMANTSQHLQFTIITVSATMYKIVHDDDVDAGLWPSTKYVSKFS